MTTPHPVLTRRFLTQFSGWRNTDEERRAGIAWLTKEDQPLMQRLEANLQRAGTPDRWFTQPRYVEHLAEVVVPAVLAGFTLREDAVADLVKAIRPTEQYQRQVLEQALRRHLMTPGALVVEAPKATLAAQTIPELRPPASAREIVRVFAADPEPSPTFAGSQNLPPDDPTPEPMSQAATLPTDPFDFEEKTMPDVVCTPAAPGRTAAVELLEHQPAFGDPRIGAAKLAGRNEQVALLLKQWSVPLSGKVPESTQDRLAAQLKCTRRQVRKSIETLRKDQGISLKTNGADNLTARVEAAVKAMGWPLSEKFPPGAVKAIAEKLQVTDAQAHRALARVRKQHCVILPGRQGPSLTEQVAQVVAEWGWDLTQPLPKDAVPQVTERLGGRAASVGCALWRVVKRAQAAAAQGQQAAPPASATAPPIIPEPPTARAVSPDRARSVVFDIAERLVALNDTEALLRAASLVEKVL